MKSYTINNDGFELFNSFGGKFSPKITISKPGGLSFSSGSYNKFKLEKYLFIQLLFNKKDTIAIRLLKEGENNSVMLKPRKDNKGGFSHIKSFIDAYGLDKYYGKGFVPKESIHPELGRLLIINLNEEK